MKLDIRTQDLELHPNLREHANRRITFALSRFNNRLTRLHMRLVDENGPRGGVDKRCVLQIGLSGMPDIVITETAENVFTAIDRAAGRAGRTLARKIGRFTQGTTVPLVIDKHPLDSVEN
jgi:putative sigma-54 modulation protein